jgi:hypothetical protein
MPVLALPHHARPGMAVNPIRERVQRVGYEGGENYIAAWRPVIERACAERGWSFVLNPASLTDVDIVLALRDQQGYAPRFWKSNVKLANAQGSGTPIICGLEAGYLETATGAELLVSEPVELLSDLDALVPVEERRWRSIRLRAGAQHLTLEAVAGMYRKWLEGLA